MPRGGSRPNSGRRKGVPNKATVERLEREKITEQAAAAVAESLGITDSVAARAIEKATRGKSLAKEELEEILPIVKGFVAYFQRQTVDLAPDGSMIMLENGQMKEFKEWLDRYIQTCFKLADFQSPRFRAIVVAAGPTPGDNTGGSPASNVISLDDQVGAARLYRRIVSAAG